ncbi:MAG: glutamate formimidoyltransferase [Candidatus Thermoplasmatota archaeon]|nr:glutamate formimidoyltransferase [Candidatus Thermoplasmatota archaeon]
MEKLVECVPNFSEGKESYVIEAISAAITSVKGVKLMNVDPGSDFNRTVYTFVGGPEMVLEAAFRAARVGTALIDMSKHKGEHARMGALDVVPFIPISGTDYDECSRLAQSLGERMWEELRVPVYLYAMSAKDPSRIKLPDIRKGEYEALPEKLKDPSFRPDIGDPVFNSRSGVTATGARQILIAYNINLDSDDKEKANIISGAIRESGVLKRDEKGEKIIGEDGRPVRIPGRFRGVQAGGMMYDERTAQVSMNLLDYEQVNLHDVFEAVKEEASKLGIGLRGSEIVGVVPKKAMINAGIFYAGEGKRDQLAENELIDIVIQELGLDSLYPFDPDTKIIEYLMKERGPLASSKIDSFLKELSSESPAPGGGSVAALSGALGASLLEMVCKLTLSKKKYENVWPSMKDISREMSRARSDLTDLIDEDTEAFNKVIAAFKLPKDREEDKIKRSAAIQEAYRHAIDVPLRTLKICHAVISRANDVAKEGNVNSVTDAGVAAEMAYAGIHGAILNVKVNLGSVKDEGYKAELIKDIDIITSGMERELSKVRGTIASKI